MGPGVSSAVRDEVFELRVALRDAIRRNMIEPSDANIAECQRLGVAYREAVEAFEAAKKVEKERNRRVDALMLEAMQTPRIPIDVELGAEPVPSPKGVLLVLGVCAVVAAIATVVHSCGP
jgi:hypothetical protein